MNNASQPLICLGVIDTAPASNGVTTTTERKPNGSYRTVAHVNGKFYACSEGRDKQDNINYIRQALAEGGHIMPEPVKVAAPKRMLLMGKLRQVVGFLKGYEAISSTGSDTPCEHFCSGELPAADPKAA